MAFYRDRDNSIWVTGVSDQVLHCISEPEEEEAPGYSVGLAMGRAQTEEAYGPLAEVEPIGWWEIV